MPRDAKIPCGTGKVASAIKICIGRRRGSLWLPLWRSAILTVAALWVTTAMADPLRIMPLGDSITVGNDNYSLTPGGYRTRLYNRIDSELYPVDFVGANQSNPNPTQLPDADHEGWGGARINVLRAVAQRDRLIGCDVVLLHAGSCDMGYQPEFAPQGLEWLLSDLYLYYPQAEIFVAQIIPMRDPDWTAKVEAFNAALPAMVARRTAQGQRVHLVDMFDAITAADLADSMHPSPAGYAKMADAWFDAIASTMPRKTSSIFDLNLIAANWNESDSSADFNGDGTVDIFDINYLARGRPSRLSVNGDFNGDGEVNIFDLNFLSGGGSPHTATPVPEPCALLLGTISFLGFLVSVRRRR